MNNPIKQKNLETKIIHRKPNEWIPLGEFEEWWSEQYKCPFCGNITLDADKYCSRCGKRMSGGLIGDD